MWNFILQIVYFLVAIGIIGALITYMVSKLLGNRENPRAREARETKILDLQRDLERTSDQLQSQRDRLVSIEAALGESANMLRGRDAQIKELQAELLSYRKIETELEVKKTELKSLNNEMGSIRAKLLEAEKLLKKTAEPDTKLVEEINSLKKSLAGKNHEITLLLSRVKELAPLTIQIRDRELRIHELEKKHVDAITNLRARISDLESKLQSAETNVEVLTTRLREDKMVLTDQEPQTDAKKDIALLKQRVNDLETMHSLAVHPPPRDKWDDLVVITHAGPSVVKMLHRLGIFNFKQVAKWDDKQIDWVDSQIDRSHGRIRQEHWVESAKNEHYKKYGERI